MYVKNKGIEFKVEVFKDWTREQFMNHYAGVVRCDLSKVWDEIQVKLNENTESNTGATVESSKDANTELSKEGNEVLVSAKGNSGLDHKAKHNRSALPKGDK